eukprot:96538-Chlamydomonas_euryale.AAC.1
MHAAGWTPHVRINGALEGNWLDLTHAAGWTTWTRVKRVPSMPLNRRPHALLLIDTLTQCTQSAATL